MPEPEAVLYQGANKQAAKWFALHEAGQRALRFVFFFVYLATILWILGVIG